MIKIGNKTIDADIEVILEELKSFILVRDNKTVLKDIKSTSDNVMVTCPYHKGGEERRPSCGISTVDKPDHPAGTVHCFTKDLKDVNTPWYEKYCMRNDWKIYDEVNELQLKEYQESLNKAKKNKLC